MLIKARRKRALPGLVTGESRQRNEASALAARMFTKTTRDIVAIHVRQSNVEEDDISLVRESRLEHFLSPVNDPHVVATDLKKHADPRGRIHVVIHDEDTFW